MMAVSQTALKAVPKRYKILNTWKLLYCFLDSSVTVVLRIWVVISVINLTHFAIAFHTLWVSFKLKLAVANTRTYSTKTFYKSKQYLSRFLKGTKRTTGLFRSFTIYEKLCHFVQRSSSINIRYWLYSFTLVLLLLKNTG